MGRTRQEFTHDGCTPTDLMYRPLKHVPLFNVNIGITQLSLGIQISSQLGINTACPGQEQYQLQPLTNVRVAGEAMGTVLFMRGAANLGNLTTSFNSHSLLLLTCVLRKSWSRSKSINSKLII
ncbi:uncharacterized protein TNIN_350651, partial [Trichonephila inaurata madagascariensis]